MEKPDKHNEHFYDDLFKQESLEKAPDGFADKVMASIEAETNQIAEKSRIFSRSNWWMWASIAIAIGGLVSVVFFVDFSFMGGIFTGIELDGSRIAQFVQYLGNGLVSAFENFSVSTISVTILISIVGLVLVDRMLRRRQKVEINIV